MVHAIECMYCGVIINKPKRLCDRCRDSGRLQEVRQVLTGHRKKLRNLKKQLKPVLAKKNMLERNIRKKEMRINELERQVTDLRTSLSSPAERQQVSPDSFS